MIDRRQFIGAIAAIFAVTPLNGQTDKKWFITGGLREDGKVYDCDIPPIVSYGKTRLDAIANSGITVWSEEEWKSIDPEAFYKSCANTRKGSK